MFAMARGTRTEAARIVRYGSEYLGCDLRGKGSATTRVARRLDTMRRGERVGLVLSYAVGAALQPLVGGTQAMEFLREQIDTALEEDPAVASADDRHDAEAGRRGRRSHDDEDDFGGPILGRD